MRRADPELIHASDELSRRLRALGLRATGRVGQESGDVTVRVETKDRAATMTVDVVWGRQSHKPVLIKYPGHNTRSGRTKVRMQPRMGFDFDEIAADVAASISSWAGQLRASDAVHAALMDSLKEGAKISEDFDLSSWDLPVHTRGCIGGVELRVGPVSPATARAILDVLSPLKGRKEISDGRRA
jgi:hypothetical protein